MYFELIQLWMKHPEVKHFKAALDTEELNLTDL